MPVQRVKDIMTTDVIVAAAFMPLPEVFILMTEHRISFIVISLDDKPVGVITERDIVRFTAEKLDAEQLLAQDVMSKPVIVEYDPNLTVPDAYHRLKLQHKKHQVIVDGEGKILGVITFTDFINQLGIESFIKHKTLSKIMTTEPVSALPATTTLEAISIMAEKKISCIIICGESGKPAGILTERDVGRLKASGTNLSGVAISELMVSPVLVVKPDMSTSDATKIMKNNSIRHLVIINREGSLIGVVTETNIILGIGGSYVKSLVDLLDEKETELRLANATLEKKVEERTKALIHEIDAHKALQGEMKKLTQALEQAGEAVMITDPDGTIEYVNAEFSKTTGYTFDDVKGQKPNILHSGRQEPLFYERMWKSIITHGAWKGTLWNRRKNGQVFPEQLHIRASKDANGKVVNYVGTFSDTSEKIALEAEYQQAKHMEAIGSLVGGVAHNFNNILAGITGHLYLANKKIEQPLKVEPHLNALSDLSNKAGEMVHQLLTFARRDVLEQKNIPLVPLIKDTLKTLRLGVPKNIQLVEDVTNENLVVYGDASQLQQVLMNMVNNARDAMVNIPHAKITVSLKQVEITSDFLSTHTHFHGESMACLIVKDNGEGISETDLERAFDPFFTTKEIGKGTGLGLSMSRGAVESHGGAIEVDSTLGKGAEFRIYLPLVEDNEKSIQSVNQKVQQGKGELILLVDDDNLLIETIASIIKGMGYRVLTAGNGEQAFSIFMKNEGEISLILSDIVMPKMGGIELMRNVRAYSDIPIVFMSGYGFEQKIPDESASMVLIKPFSVPLLSEVLVKALEVNESQILHSA